MSARTPEEAEHQLRVWLSSQTVITAAMSIVDVAAAGSYIKGTVVEADGQRAVEGSDSGFVLIPPPDEADDIDIERTASGVSIVLDYGEFRLRLSDSEMTVEADA